MNAFVMLGMGGPNNLADVETFLLNLLSDKELIDFHLGPLQSLLARFIVKKRTPIALKRYALMGGGSPQLAHTQNLLKKVSFSYEILTGEALDVYPAMCYFAPYIEEVAETLSAKGYKKIFVATQYPEYCKSTAGTAISRFLRAADKRKFERNLVIFNRYSHIEGYIAAMERNIRDAYGRLGKKPSEAHLLFSAHSVPVSVIKRGDSYLEELKALAEELSKRLAPKSYSLAFQSRVGPVRWLSPFLEQELARLASAGIKEIVLAAVSFINDHIETLVELDIELAEYAGRLGVKTVRAESLNDNDSFAQALAEMMV